MMRIVWGLYDNEQDYLVCIFEAENLLVGYRDQLLRDWYDLVTKEIPERDYLPGEELIRFTDDQARNERKYLLDLGYDRWRADQINMAYPRYQTKKYELWNSVPPNPERLVMHFDT